MKRSDPFTDGTRQRYFRELEYRTQMAITCGQMVQYYLSRGELSMSEYVAYMKEDNGACLPLGMKQILEK